MVHLRSSASTHGRLDGVLMTVDPPQRSLAMSGSVCRCDARRWTRFSCGERDVNRRSKSRRDSLRTLVVAEDRVIGVDIADDAGVQRVRAASSSAPTGERRVAELAEAAIQEEHRGSRAMYFRYATAMAGPEGDPDARVFPRRRRTCLCLSERWIDVVHRRVGEPGSLLRDAFRWQGSARGAARDASVSWRHESKQRPGSVACSAAVQGIGVVRVSGGCRLGVGRRCIAAPGPVDRSRHGQRRRACDVPSGIARRDPLGRAREDESMATYHRRRDEHALAAFRETCELGRNLNTLRSPGI